MSTIAEKNACSGYFAKDKEEVLMVSKISARSSTLLIFAVVWAVCG